MSSRHRCLSLAFLLCVGFGFIAGCGRSSAPPQADAIVELRAGVIPVAECAILLDEAVFLKHGIRLTIQRAQSGTQITDGVIGGGLEVGFSNLVTPIIARARDIPLRIIGPISLEDDKRARHGLLVRTDAKAPQGPQQLRGRTIALNALRNIDHLMLLRWLGEHGLSEDALKIQITPFPNMLPALTGGAVDAAALVEPFITAASSSAAPPKVLGNYYSSKSGRPTAVSGFVAREDWLAKNPAVAAKLYNALIEAASNAEKQEAQFRKFVVAMTKTDAAVVEKMPLPWYQPTGYDTHIADLIAVAVSHQFAKKDVSADTLIYRASAAK
jgi:NitT/TauT family transport system substrate-binding protein